jgi:hypothetical protein
MVHQVLLNLEVNMFQVERKDNGLIVNGQPQDVIAKLKSSDWGWKTQWGNAPDGTVMFEVKGSFMKDNAAAAIVEVGSLSDGRTTLFVQGDRGAAMNALGGNVFNVGVKRFIGKVLDKAQQILAS